MLIDILTKISRAKGKLNLGDAAVKQSWVDKINDTARSLYEYNELLDENVPIVIRTTNLSAEIVALPADVLVPIQLRNLANQLIFTFSSQTVRFQDCPVEWDKITFIKRSPLCREILNAGPLVFTTADTDTAVYRIAGRTTKASYHIETLNITNGLTAMTQAFWIDVESITQDPHATDTTVTDIDGNVMAEIPNANKASSYCLYRFKDAILYKDPSLAGKLELLYKPIFRPMLDDRAEFQCGSRYDDPIMWGTLSRDALITAKDPKLANAYEGKALELIRQLHAAQKPHVVQVMTEEDRFANLSSNDNHTQRFYRRY